jgi:mercuric ion binding protein
MKKIVSALFLIAYSVTVIAQSKVERVSIATSIACDHCKKCGTCAQRIEDALYALKGVKRVDVDSKNNKILVAYNTDKLVLEDIKETIAANGYDADEVKATEEAVATLEDCCKQVRDDEEAE